MRWSEIIGNSFRAFLHPSKGLLRAGALIAAAVCLSIVAATLSEPSPASTLVTVASLICYLSGVLWLCFAVLDRAGWVHAEDWKMHVALVRHYLKGFVIRDRR